MLPPTWHDKMGHIGARPGAQCSAGCTNKAAPGELGNGQACGCQWYTNWTFVQNATIPQSSPLRTYDDFDAEGRHLGDWTCDPKLGEGPRGSCRPWRAPGRAWVNSPCGVDGGNFQGCPAGNPHPQGCADGGYGHGPDSRHVRFPDVITTKWKANSVVDTAWGITANPGGGYAYRLCPRPLLNRFLTEECFQRNVLTAVGPHTVAYPNGTSSTFPAVRFTTGTFPTGSQWTRNPIPACKGPYGGTKMGNSSMGGDSQCHGFQFPPPLGDALLGGFGNKMQHYPTYHKRGIFNWYIRDRVQVPDLPAGQYVMSFRFDSEQTPQVWMSCSNIEIVRD